MIEFQGVSKFFHGKPAVEDVSFTLPADPEVLLMDEPFGALDLVTRSALQGEIARIHQISRRTIVLVTHDIDEALILADRILLLDGGRIVQQGTPQQMLLRPASRLVRDFFGGGERGNRLLSLGTAGELARPGKPLPGPPISAAMSRRAALSEFIARATDRLPVVDEQGGALGVLHFADLLRPLKEME